MGLGKEPEDLKDMFYFILAWLFLISNDSIKSALVACNAALIVALRTVSIMGIVVMRRMLMIMVLVMTDGCCSSYGGAHSGH